MIININIQKEVLQYVHSSKQLRVYGCLSLGLLMKFTVSGMNSSYGTGFRFYQKQLVTPITVVPLLHLWAHLVQQVSIAACRGGCRPPMSLLPQQPAQYQNAQQHSGNQRAGRKFSSQFQVDFSVSYTQCVWCLQQQGLIIWLCWEAKNNGNSPCCLGSLRGLPD